MNFKAWFYENIVGDQPFIKTQSFAVSPTVATGKPGQGVGSPLFKVLTAAAKVDPGVLSPYETRHPDGRVTTGFQGTLDYSAPEQQSAIEKLETSSDRDNYEHTLVVNTGLLLPDMERQAKEIAGMWRRFRSVLVKRRNDLNILPPTAKTQYSPDPESVLDWYKPIVYSVYLGVLKRATTAFELIKAALPEVNDPLLSRLFEPLFNKQMEFYDVASRRLAPMLAQSREDPKSYQ